MGASRNNFRSTYNSKQQSSKGNRQQTQTRLRSLSREDLIQEGCIGLSKAIDKFNPSMYENRFATYAAWWVKSCILRAIAEYDDLVRVPEHVVQNIRKIRHVASCIGIDMDNVGNDVEMNILAKESGLTLQQVQRAMHAFQVKRRVASQLEPWMVSSSSSELMNSQQSNSDSSETKLAIKNVLSTVLKPREMEALSLRYGLTQPDSDVRV